MLKVGLTGGIGAGKSAAAECFAALAVPVVDADRIARALVEPDHPAHAEVIRAFGADILDAHGNIDRAVLRDRVFHDGDQRLRLEAILHPRIRTEIRRELAALQAPYGIVVIPLLVETGQQHLVDRVLVIEADESKRIARVRARDNISEQDVRRIMAAQASDEERLAAADDTLVNDGDAAQLRAQVERLHHRYLSLAAHEENG